MELIHNKWMVTHEKDHIAFEKKFLHEIGFREKIQKVWHFILLRLRALHRNYIVGQTGPFISYIMSIRNISPITNKYGRKGTIVNL
jgi:hypothetical protein